MEIIVETKSEIVEYNGVKIEFVNEKKAKILFGKDINIIVEGTGKNIVDKCKKIIDSKT